MTDARSGADHRLWDELAVGWALHALEPEDEAVFAAHLAGCGRCSRTVAETAEVMAAMATDLPPAEPGEGLRDRLREAVERTEQVPQSPQRGQRERDDEVARDLARELGAREDDVRPNVVADDADVVPLAGRRRTDVPGGALRRPRRPGQPGPAWKRVLPSALVAAAVAAVLALGTWTVVLSDARDRAQTEAARASQIVGSLLTPGTVTVAPMTASDGSAVATVLARNGQAQVVTTGLQVNDQRSDVYVLWGIRGTDPVGLGTFDVVSSQTDLRTVGSDSTGLDGYSSYAISIERGRQVPEKPSIIVANGQVTS